MQVIRIGLIEPDDVLQRLLFHILRIDLLDQQMRNGIVLPQRDEGLQVARIGEHIGTGQAQAHPFQVIEPAPEIGIAKRRGAVRLVVSLKLDLQVIGRLGP